MALSIALLAQPALAQGQPTEETLAQSGAAPDDSVILVTGSRIASPTLEATAPLQIVDAQSIADSGVTNIQELLLENPAFGTPALSRTNSAFLLAGAGVATVDLRDLGSDRTLVLINGRRVVSSLSGTATVDLNVIPTQFVERIDILTGGASSLYGSDAVAGVVNFVYKNDFEGIEAEAQYGLTERGDSQRYQGSITVGTNVADNRGNIMAHFGYSKEEGLLSRQRRDTVTDGISLAFLTGDINDLYTDHEPFYSSFAPQGRFITENGTFTYDAGGNLISGFSTNGPDVDGDGLGDGGPAARGFNRQFYRTLAVPVERFLFASRGTYGVTDNINVFFEGTYNKTRSSREIEPFAASTDTSTGVYPSAGVMPVENYVIDGGALTIVRNPLVPDAIFDAATDQDGDGLRDIGWARRLTEFGTRNSSSERDFYRAVLGLQGDLFDGRFNWDLSYNHGHVSELQVSNGQVNVANFRNALAVMVDTDDVNGNGSTTDYICIDPEARAAGCVPANIFGEGTISDAAAAYIQAPGTLQTSIKQQVVQGNISGSVFELPGGSAGFATGFEYRKESSSEDWDILTNQGLNAGNVVPDTEGSFDVIEAYAEVKLPIISNTPFFELLEVGGAARVADYSTVGTVFSWNVTCTWQPIEDIRLRGTYAKAVRAPNVAELYSGLSQTFPPGLVDPCEDVGPTGGGAVGDNCRADPGVAANIAANGLFTLTQSDLQGISGFNGGNPDLQEETATSWTVGAVINPRSIDALRNLSLTVDYYNVEIDDVIAAFPRQFILQQCYETGDDQFCDLVIRRPTNTATNSAGSIEFLNAFSVNAARMKTDGLDVTLNYSTPIGFTPNDRVNFRLAYTHLFNWDYFPTADADPDPADGEIGSAKDRFTANVAYDTGNFRWAFTGTYIGKSYEDDQFCTSWDVGIEAKCMSVGAEFYLDTQLAYRLDNGFELYGGVDNLLDNKAPLIPTQTTFNTTGADTAADVYDIFGRRFYVGARIRF